ncbi:MAG: hypothetical protein WCH34_08820 [Bacteroidota bacterium]
MKSLLTLLAICYFSLHPLFSQETFKATYGVPGFNYGVASRPAANGGYMVFGNRTGVNGNSDIYCVRIDSLGAMVYDKIIDFGYLEVATDVCYIKDQGYGIIGYTYVSSDKGYDMLLIRTDTACNVLWSKSYGGNDWDMAYSIISLADSGFIFCGETYSNSAGQNDAFICRTNSIGDTIWTRKLGGSGSDVFYSLDSTNNNNYYAAGSSNSFGAGDLNLYFAKFTMDGDTLWTRSMGDPELNEIAYSVCTSVDQGVILGGVATDTLANSISHHYLIKLDSIGNYLWHEWPFWLAKNDEIQSVHQRKDSTIVYAGYTENFGGGGKDIMVYYLNDDHSLKYGATIGDLYTETSNDVMFTPDGGCIVTGSTNHDGLYTSDIYVIKLDSVLYYNTLTSHYTGIEESKSNDAAIQLHIAPNPAENYVTLSLSTFENLHTLCNLYSLQGTLVYSKPLMFNEGKATLPVSELVPSAYIISIQFPNMLIEKSLLIKK